MHQFAAQKDGSPRLESSSGTQKYAVPALDNGLDLLEALAACSVPESLTDLARITRRAPSQLFRLLNRLEQRSYIRKDPNSGRYSLTLKLFQLAHTHSPVEYILRAADAPLRHLSERINESVHLSVLSHGRLVVLLDVGSPFRIRFTHEVGAQFPAALTNSGRLLLAHLAPERLDDHLRHDPDFQAMTLAEQQAFRSKLPRITKQGYAISNSSERAGMKDLAVLVGDPVCGAVAALAVACLSGGKTRQDLQHLADELRSTAATVTGNLGLTYDPGILL